MSVVVAIKENGVIYMGADTMVTVGSGRRQLKTPHTQKIWAVSDTPNCIMGGVGYLSVINLIRYCSKNIVPEVAVLKNELDAGVIMEETMPQLCALITEYRKMCNTFEEKEGITSEFVIGVNDHLFLIATDGLVEELEDYTAIGSGANSALASLSTTEGEPVYTRITKALNAAVATNAGVLDPYVYINNDDGAMLTSEMLMSMVDKVTGEEELKNSDPQDQSSNSQQIKPNKKEKRK